MLPPATPREARAAGLDSLASRQSRGGWWTAWRGIAGGSDEYPTAVIAATVATVPGGADLAARGWEALRGRGRFRRALGHAGWGWNETLPDDADTTSWALRAAHGTGCTDAADAAVLSLLDACSSPQGVASYAGDQPIREYHGDRFPEGYDMSTLTAPIPTITAAAALALPDRGPALREALRHAQHPDGTWRDLWWATPALPTLLAVEALAAGGAGDAEPILAAATWGASVRPATAFDSPSARAATARSQPASLTAASTANTRLSMPASWKYHSPVRS